MRKWAYGIGINSYRVGGGAKTVGVEEPTVARGRGNPFLRLRKKDHFLSKPGDRGGGDQRKKIFKAGQQKSSPCVAHVFHNLGKKLLI